VVLERLTKIVKTHGSKFEHRYLLYLLLPRHEPTARDEASSRATRARCEA
jgi:hypothetical protein